MNLEEIKSLLHDGGKIVIVENDKPVFVILGYEQYRKRGGEASMNPTASQAQSPVAPPPQRAEEELTLDDLPL